MAGRMLWVRSEAFDHGAFNTSVRWTVPKVMEFLGSFRSAVASVSIVRTVWVEVSTTRCKPALTEAEAMAYWHVFVVLQQSILTSSEESDRAGFGMISCWKSRRGSRVPCAAVIAPSDISLDIRIIGLLLMSQVFSPQRGRTDQFAKSGEMWPGLERASAGVSSPRHSPRGASPRITLPGLTGSQASVNHRRDVSSAMLAFTKQHLGYFLQVACLALQVEPQSVSQEEFDILGLLLCAGTSPGQPLRRLSEAIPELCQKRTMPMTELLDTAEKLLTWNEEVYTSVDHPVQEPIDPTGGQTVNITGMSKATWFQGSASPDIEFLHITSCDECTIYITAKVSFCLIAGCRDCTLIMSAVSGMCTIHNCEKLSVHVSAHSFKMENSIDSSAYLFCHVPPILTGDTRGIKLAPFNVLYSQMSSILQSAKMNLDPEFVDIWSHPICCTLGALDETSGGRSGSQRADGPNHSTYHFVHPSTFQPVLVPEPGGKALRARDGRHQLVLPQVYDDALKGHEEEMAALQRLMADTGDEAKSKRAQQAIQGHFREWLQSTGKARQLADLAKMAQLG